MANPTGYEKEDCTRMSVDELRNVAREYSLDSKAAIAKADHESLTKLITGEIDSLSPALELSTTNPVEFKLEAPVSAPRASSRPSPSASPSAAGGADVASAAAALAAALAGAGARPSVDVAQVEQIAKRIAAEMLKTAAADMLKAANEAAVKTIVVKRETESGPVKMDLGVQHKHFELLLKVCQVRDDKGLHIPVYLYGPAGTGKTTAARNVAKALGLECRYTGAIMSKYDLTGMVNANGEYVPSDFYHVYKNGGVFLLDDFDGSDPRAQNCFLDAFANGHASFPQGKNGGGIVQRHRDCIIIAGGNTCGRGEGAAAGFGSRSRLDTAFLDRFLFLDWPVDDKMEMGMARALGGESWLKEVREYRKNAAGAGIKGSYAITPRATVYGASLLAAGISHEDVVNLTVRKGLDSATWAKIGK